MQFNQNYTSIIELDKNLFKNIELLKFVSYTFLMKMDKATALSLINISFYLETKTRCQLTIIERVLF